MSTKHARRLRNFDFMRVVKQMPCCLRAQGDCEGVVEADHAGARPFGRRAPDESCIPLCQKHHADRTLRNGIFSGMSPLEMRVWCASKILDTQRRYLAHRRGLEIL